MATKTVNLGRNKKDMPHYLLECGHEVRLTPAERSRGKAVTWKYCRQCLSQLSS